MSKISHLEFGTHDAQQSRLFFEQLFGWTFAAFKGGQQATIDIHGTSGGLHDGVSQPNIRVYFQVSDIHAAVRQVRQLGGLSTEPAGEPGHGQFASCVDSQGLPFGLHQPGGHR
ncbi:MAG: VOC family protein [Myxococcota bacterium]